MRMSEESENPKKQFKRSTQLLTNVTNSLFVMCYWFLKYARGRMKKIELETNACENSPSGVELLKFVFNSPSHFYCYNNNFKICVHFDVFLLFMPAGKNEIENRACESRGEILVPN